MSSADAYRQDLSPLEVRLRPWGFAPVLLGLSFPVLLSLRLLLDPSSGLSFPLGCATLAFGAGGAVFVLTVRRRLRAMGCLVRLDAEGVTVHGRRTVPWPDLSEVRWGPGGGRRPAAVVFVARPGVTLPALPSVLPFSRPAARAAALTRRFGSPLVILPGGLDTTAPRILAGVQRLSDVPLSTD
ncbi:hypothetical protein [Kitasatospora sp. NPDC088351]|uniref:hypothetical protein n=1 Tax=unclassified Kitasatospora TaxID=2633591 RepID=UPI003422566F